MKKILRGVLVGACGGACVLAADVLVTFTTHRHRFDPRLETYLLIGLVGAALVAVGAVAGGLVAALLRGKGPNPWLLPPLILVLAAGSFFFLRDRQHLVRGSVPFEVTASAPRDVIWIVVDTLRADALYGGDLQGGGLSAYDNAKGPLFPDAPQLSRLASQGTVFTNAEAPSGWTLPSTAALLTGVSPARLDARRGLLPAGASTAAELLRAAGWRTTAHVDNTLLDESNGFAAGFQRFEKRIPMDFGWRLKTCRVLPARLREQLRHSYQISYTGADKLVDRALTELEEADARPLFLYVHAMDVHAPYWTELEDAALRAAAQKLPGLDGTGRDSARKDARFLSDEQKAAFRALYQAELGFVDRELGRLLDRFDELRDIDEAVVVVTSDHGEEFWEHGKMGHGHALYGEVVRIPLVIRAPAALSAAAPNRSATPVSLTDVLPTVAELVGLEVEGGDFDFDGNSVAPILRGETYEPQPLHAEQFRFNRTTHRWRDGDLVLLQAKLPDAGVRIQLFDVGTDPGETHDLSDERPDDLRRMQSALAAYLEALERGALDSGGAQRNDQGLEDLGY